MDSLPEPDDAKAAIAMGIKLCEEQRYEEAGTFFERALELPGSGVKRFRCGFVRAGNCLGFGQTHCQCRQCSVH
jgi:hypothetical protein